MPTKMATCCKEKAVLVRVYVEKPRRKVTSSIHDHHPHHHHHHHYLHAHHHTIKPERIQHKHGGTGNRRSELLRYSQRLRESAQPSTPSQPNPTSNNQQTTTNTIVDVRRKQRNAGTPACLGNWKIVIPSFLRSLTSLQAKNDRKNKKSNRSTGNKMKSVMKSLELQKRSGFISKLLSTLRKHR